MANPVVVFDTNHGPFEVELYEDKAPVTVQNFMQYVDDKHYDGTVFHRVLDGFMIQGGGFDTSLNQKPTRPTIKNESGNGVKNVEYGIAMARTNDLDSASSQFFINVKNNTFLDDNQYCAFGLVTAGKDVVDKIKKVPVSKTSVSEGQPNEAVVVNSATRKA